MDSEVVTNIKNDFSILMRNTQHEIQSLKKIVFRLYFIISICLTLLIIAMATNYLFINDLKSVTQKITKTRSK